MNDRYFYLVEQIKTRLPHSIISIKKWMSGNGHTQVLRIWFPLALCTKVILLSVTVGDRDLVLMNEPITAFKVWHTACGVVAYVIVSKMNFITYDNNTQYICALFIFMNIVVTAVVIVIITIVIVIVHIVTNATIATQM